MSGLETWVMATAITLLLGAWHAAADRRDIQRAWEGKSCDIV